MSQIPLINDGDFDARSKINLAIQEANKVGAKASQAALDALQGTVGGKASQSALEATNEALASSTAQLGARLDEHEFEITALYPGSEERPGDTPVLFTSSLTGAGKAQKPIDFGVIVSGQDGMALRVKVVGPDPAVVASRADQAVEAGVSYAARVSARRHKDTSDPLGDTVQFGIACLNAAKQKVSERIFFEESVVTADGLVSRQVTFSRDQEAALTLSETTRYVRPFVRIFGGDGITDVVVVGSWKTTGLIGPKGDTGDVTPVLQTLRDEAVVSAVSTAQDRALAQTAAELATASAGTWNTPAIGISKTVSGQVFGVPSTNDAESTRLYLNSGGMAVDTGKTIPNAKAVTAISGSPIQAFGRAVLSASTAIYASLDVTVEFLVPLKGGPLRSVRWSVTTGTTAVEVKLLRRVGLNFVKVDSRTIATEGGAHSYEAALGAYAPMLTRNGDRLAFYPIGGKFRGADAAVGSRGEVAVPNGNVDSIPLSAVVYPRMRFELGFEIDTGDALARKDLDATARRAAQLLEALASPRIQTIGILSAPVTATFGSNYRWVYANKLTADGTLQALRVFVQVARLLELYAFDDLGDALATTIEPIAVLSLAAGANEFSLAAGTLPALRWLRGQQVGFYAGGDLAITAGEGSVGGGVYRIGPNNAIETKGSLFTGFKQQIGFDFKVDEIGAVQTVYLLQSDYDALSAEDKAKNITYAIL